ncbi:MAG: LytTR family DNA-binding domain-containing protein [Oscillospiraceae bacterium]|jgi:DNA-binding LytR/AlgR family response regulator|nr:LytTR family DNA-binding domain-containing protein [Oscillospiraceae bacterium]
MRIAICDDEIIHLERLKTLVLNCSLWRGNVTVLRYQQGQRLLEDLENCEKSRNCEKFEYIFLDIDMPGLSGIELCNKLPQGTEAGVIFVSSHMNYQPLIDEKYPALLISKKSSQDAFDDAIRAYKARIDALCRFEFTDKGKDIKIPFKNIFYITMSDHHLMINTRGGCYNIPARLTLREIEENYKNQGLYCCHKSYLINLRYYSAHDFKTVYLDNGNKEIKIPLSRKKGKGEALKSAYLNYMIGEINAL